MPLEWRDKPTEPGRWLQAHRTFTSGFKFAQPVIVTAYNLADAHFFSPEVGGANWKYLGPLPEFPKQETPDAR